MDSLESREQAEDKFVESNTDLLNKISQPLLHWYDSHARILPWREQATPYRVWISEIMLQQTRVEAVKPYFERFVKELPTVEALSKVEEDALLKLWEGLGYYNRARNLKKAAQVVMEQFAGELPADYEALLTLPGIGNYTAGAIASIAYGIAVPAVDGNVLRVITRITVNPGDIGKQSVKDEIYHQLIQVMPKGRAGAFNQALMEIGAMVCIPNGLAKCDICPLASLCLANRYDKVSQFPFKQPKKPRKIENKTVLLIQSAEKVAIRKRKSSGLLAGLYEFPNVEGFLSEEEALLQVKQMGFSPIRIKVLEESKHIFTHKEWHMIGYAVRIDEWEPAKSSGQKLLFIEPEQTQDQYPIPTAFHAYTHYMNMKLGTEQFNTD